MRRGSFTGPAPSVSDRALKTTAGGLESGIGSNFGGCSFELWTKRRADLDCEFDITAPTNKRAHGASEASTPFRRLLKFGQIGLSAVPSGIGGAMLRRLRCVRELLVPAI